MASKRILKEYVVTYYDKGNSMIYKVRIKAPTASAAIAELKWDKRGYKAGIKKVTAKLFK